MYSNDFKNPYSISDTTRFASASALQTIPKDSASWQLPMQKRNRKQLGMKRFITAGKNILVCIRRSLCIHTRSPCCWKRERNKTHPVQKILTTEKPEFLRRVTQSRGGQPSAFICVHLSAGPLWVANPPVFPWALAFRACKRPSGVKPLSWPHPFIL